MANPNGNPALFFDLGGTLVKLNDARELPLDAGGNIVIELLPGVAEKLRPLHNHLMFVVTNQAGITRGRLKIEKVEAALEQLDHQFGDILTAANLSAYGRRQLRMPQAKGRDDHGACRFVRRGFGILDDGGRSADRQARGRSCGRREVRRGERFLSMRTALCHPDEASNASDFVILTKRATRAAGRISDSFATREAGSGFLTALACDSGFCLCFCLLSLLGRG